MELKVGQKFGVKKDYYVKEIIHTVTRLKEILNNEIISEPIGIVTKKGDLKIISEAFLNNKFITTESQIDLFYKRTIKRGCFLVSFEPIDVLEPIEETQSQVEEVIEKAPISEDFDINDEDLPIFQPISSTENDLTLEELAHKESMEAYNKGIEIKSGAVTFNLIALVVTLIAFKFFIHIDAIYFYIGLGVILLANVIFFIRFRKIKN